MSPDVPQEIVEQIEFLFDELNGALEADGWQNPVGQLKWIALRLEEYAEKFHTLSRTITRRAEDNGHSAE